MKLLPATLLALGAATWITGLAAWSDQVSSYEACADGWRSPSIGRRGACSWHGGVKTFVQDNRSTQQRLTSYGLDGLGAVLVAIAAILLWSAATELERQRFHLSKEQEEVTLTLGKGDARLVKLKRISNDLYKTALPVGICVCAAGRRHTIYKTDVEFHRQGDAFQARLTTWIPTRGRAGGYTARIFDWSSEAPPPQVAEEKLSSPG